MNVEVIAPDQSDRWEDYLNRSPRTVAWQSYRWNQAVNRVYSADFLPLMATDGDSVVGILPLYQLRSGRSRLYSVPYAVAGGITADSVSVQHALLEGAREIAARRQAPGITFKQYRWPIAAPLRTDDNYFNRELALDVSEAAIWEGLAPANREAIDTAERRELRLEYPTDRVDEFYQMLFRHLKRQGLPAPSPRWIQTLLDLGLYRIALLEERGRVIAGTLVKAFKHTVSFPFSCMNDFGGQGLTATYVLYWRLLQRFRADGFTIFHSGRIPKTEAVEKYRLGWGGQRHPYHYQYYPESGGKVEYQRKRGWKRRLFTASWKVMPGFLARTIGPRIVARFP